MTVETKPPHPDEHPPAARACTGPPKAPAPTHSAPPPQSKESQTPPQIDGKAFYGYLFKKDKTATDLLCALLRAIAKHTATQIGDKTCHELNKTKLAAFYKTVGGDYDSLFLNAPDKSISYIWQALGVQHSLQPTENDYAEPCIPALTEKGFVRWESLQILLGPEEHVPFVQFAVRNWNLRHPDTGVLFPADLPAEAFPSQCDPAIDQWHRKCAQRLRLKVNPEDENPRPAGPDPRVQFSHVRGPHATGSRHGPAMDYFERERPIPFVHLSRGGHKTSSPYHPSPSPGKRRPNSIGGSRSPERARPRSWNDYASPRSPGHLDHRGRPPPAVRRHSSQPRHLSPSGSDSEDEIPMPNMRPKLRPVERTPAHSVRVFSPDGPVTPVAIPLHSHRTELRQGDHRRRSLPSEPKGTFGIREKLKSFLPGANRSQSVSRGDRDNLEPSRGRLRPEIPTSRLSRGWTDDSEDSDSDVSLKRSIRRDRERDRLLAYDLEREIKRERELEEERERRSRKDRAYYHRPTMSRRTSSAADVDRRVRDLGQGSRSSERGWDRSRDSRRGLAGDERERRRHRERLTSPVMVGVGGRKYPTENMKPAWA